MAKSSEGSTSVDLRFLVGMAYCLSAIPIQGLSLGQSCCQAVTLQRLAEGPDDAKQCEGSEAISNLTEESGV